MPNSQLLKRVRETARCDWPVVGSREDREISEREKECELNENSSGL